MKTNLNSILDQILAKMNSIPIWYEINQQFDFKMNETQFIANLRWNPIKMNLNQIQRKSKIIAHIWPKYSQFDRKSIKILINSCVTPLKNLANIYLKLAHFWPFLRENQLFLTYFGQILLKIDENWEKIAQNQLFLPENLDKIFNHFSRKSSKNMIFSDFSLIFSGFNRENFILKVPPFTWKNA